MLSKRAGVTFLVLTAAIAAHMETSLLMPASAHPKPPSTVPERPTRVSISQEEDGVTLRRDDPGDKSITGCRIVRKMLQDGRLILTSNFNLEDWSGHSFTDTSALPTPTRCGPRTP